MSDATPHTPAPSAPDRVLAAVSAAPFDPRRWSHWWVHVGSPLGVSVACHALLILIFAGLTWAVDRPADDDAPVEFEARVIAEGPADRPGGGFRFPGQAMLNRPDAARSFAAPPVPSGLADLARQTGASPLPAPAGLDAIMNAHGAESTGRNDIIGIGPGGAAAFQAAGAGGGQGDRDVAGGGPIGGLWGVGRGQRARSVVFVVDRSGSFIDWVEAIDLELKRSIGLLQADQFFNLIFLRDNSPLAMQPRLIAADEAAKRQAFAWINTNPPSGGSNLTPAVTAALRFAPEVLFIVTDYALLSSPVESTNLPDLMKSVRTARRKHPMTVNVILMGPFDRPQTSAEELRRQIEKRSDGLTPEREGVLREQIDLLDTLDAIERLPRETRGTLQYLNGDALMDEWRRTHARS